MNLKPQNITPPKAPFLKESVAAKKKKIYCWTKELNTMKDKKSPINKEDSNGS